MFSVSILNTNFMSYVLFQLVIRDCLYTKTYVSLSNAKYNEVLTEIHVSIDEMQVTRSYVSENHNCFTVL